MSLKVMSPVFSVISIVVKSKVAIITVIIRIVIVSLCHCFVSLFRVIVTSCRCVIVSLCRCVIVLLCYCVIVSMCHCVILSLRCCVVVSLCRCVVESLLM